MIRHAGGDGTRNARVGIIDDGDVVGSAVKFRQAALHGEGAFTARSSGIVVDVGGINGGQINHGKSRIHIGIDAGAVHFVQRLVGGIGADNGRKERVESNGRPPVEGRCAAVKEVDQTSVVKEENVAIEVALGSHPKISGRRRVHHQAGVGGDVGQVRPHDDRRTVVKGITDARRRRGVGIAAEVGIAIVKDVHHISKAEVHGIQVHVIALGRNGAERDRAGKVLLAYRTGKSAFQPLHLRRHKSERTSRRLGLQTQSKKKSGKQEDGKSLHHNNYLIYFQGLISWASPRQAPAERRKSTE